MKTTGQKLDIICYSIELKKLVQSKLIANAQSLVGICKEQRLIYEDMRIWLYDEPKEYNSYTQVQVIKLAEYLGIKISIIFAIDESVKQAS